MSDWKRRLLLKGRKDPTWWIENVLGDKLWSKQREISAALVTNERVGVPACFDDQTEILTKSPTGSHHWKLFRHLDDEDLVATLVDDKIVYEKPQHYYEGDYDGELFGVRNHDVDFLVTPNHRLYVMPSYSPHYTFRSASSSYGYGYHLRSFLNVVSPDLYVSSVDWYKKHYMGKVYCVETSLGIIAVRRNGKAHWSGNSEVVL